MSVKRSIKEKVPLHSSKRNKVPCMPCDGCGELFKIVDLETNPFSPPGFYGSFFSFTCSSRCKVIAKDKLSKRFGKLGKTSIFR